MGADAPLYPLFPCLSMIRNCLRDRGCERVLGDGDDVPQIFILFQDPPPHRPTSKQAVLTVNLVVVEIKGRCGV